ncbi:MAG: bifunctional aspartate kinase/homoserine dehydrogenase I, partial [Bacteroidota bacterium]
KELQEISHRNNAQYLFETNVGAGLPVISTLKDLVRSGDKIHRIDAVLSGTLNYLFNTYDGSTKFVEVVKDAKAKGLTEPDPRLDLFGEDVKRKILILARESGGQPEMEDVQLTPFVPQECIDAEDLTTFYQLVEKNEDHFAELYKQAHSKNRKLRVVASLEGEKIEVGLKDISDDHPFYYLEGKDNIVLFYTDRYQAQPLVIKGAGAGAEVTASGIFADVLKTGMD